MKRLIIKLSLLFTIILFGATKTYAATDNKPDHTLAPSEIAIRTATSTIKPDIERSLIKPVRAFLYRADSEIELLFNIVLGNTRVEIVDEMGMIVDVYELPISIYNSTAIINAPITPGHYTINIYANSYHGIGDFDIF